MVKSLGSVRTDVFESVINFKCMAAPGATPPVVAYVHFHPGHVAVRIHHRNQYGRQGHPDTSYGDRLGLTGVTISDLA